MVDRTPEQENTVEGKRIAALEYARQMHERITNDIQASKDYAIMCLRSLVLLNGGAIVAILTLIGTVLDQPTAGLRPASFVPAFQAYVLGLVFVVIAMVFGYFNFQLHASTRPRPSALANNIIQPQDSWPTEVTNWQIKGTMYTAIFFGVASLVAFLVGGCFVQTVFLSVSGP